MSDTVHIEPRITTQITSRLRALFDLTKPRISTLVLLATGAGFYLAAPWHPFYMAGALLAHALFGTALVAVGSNALNHYLEAPYDAMMRRTQGRPIPTGRLTPTEVLLFGILCGAGGGLYLAWKVNTLAAMLGMFTLGSYVLAYTPLKRISPMSVFVGAIPGALPPMIGWAAACGSIGLEAWLLFAVVFFWQLPHFASIAWIYRDDYRRGGFPVLSVIDSHGTRTNLHVVTHSIGLLVASLLPVLYGIRGVNYAIGALLLGLAFLAVGVAFLRTKSLVAARRFLLASIIYLPLLFILMMLDRAGWL